MIKFIEVSSVECCRSISLMDICYFCVPDVVCFAPVYLSNTTAQSLIRYAIFSRTGPSRRVDCWHWSETCSIFSLKFVFV